jgi:hypothetical protein
VPVIVYPWRETVAGLAMTGALALPSSAPATGGLTIYPGKSIDTAPIRVHTSAGCPDQADTYYATAKGHGFPAAGLIVTAPTAAGMSHTAGFDAYFAETLKDFADDNHTTLEGTYDVTVFCIDSFSQNSFAEFTGSLHFTTPTTYEAVGAAMPPPQSTSSPPVVAAPGVPPPGATLVPGGAPPAATTRPAVPTAERAATPTKSGGTPWSWLAAGLVAIVAAAFEGGRRVGLRGAGSAPAAPAPAARSTNREPSRKPAQNKPPQNKSTSQKASRDNRGTDRTVRSGRATGR